MKLISFIVFLSFINLSFAFDTSVKGFIALNAFDLQKIEKNEASPQIGIGVLDLKIFAEQDNMSAALKLDLDGKLSEDYNLFEEAYATYRGVPDFKFSLGKGVVKFQNLHWGAVQNTYQDGGSILGSENSYRKLSKRAFISSSYGHRSKGFLNTTWIFGESSEINYDNKGNPRFASTSNVKTYQTSSVKSFSTDLQFGIANKIELYHFNNLTLTNGLVFYRKKPQTGSSYAIDFGTIYETDTIEIWSDLLVGHTQKPKFDNYSTYSNNEYYLQLGFEKNLNDTWSWVNNAEFLYSKNQSWVYESSFVQDGKTYTVDSSLTEKSGQIVKSTSYKVETAAKYKLSKTAFTTVGVLYEHKKAVKNGVADLSYIPSVNNPNRSAYEFITSISFWF